MDISFSWIFALLVGGFILFGAIYGVTKFISIEETRVSAESAFELGTLMNPLETSIESGKSIRVLMPVESRIRNGCAESGNFGIQQIEVEEYMKGSWTDAPVTVPMESKYIFSEWESEGREFYVFSKPFDYPYKVANALYLISKEKKYCFVNPPIKIKKELKDLDQDNILFEDCKNMNNVETVCFSSTGCDIDVGYNGKYVKKGVKTMYFDTDALMYGAIFADQKIYECQTKRLIKKAAILSDLYEEKALFLQPKGCVSDVLSSIGQLKLIMQEYSQSSDLASMTTLVSTIKTTNSYSKCRLW